MTLNSELQEILNFSKNFFKKNTLQKSRFFYCSNENWGVSGQNIFSHMISSKEIVNSFKKNKISFSYLLIYLRFITKIHQLFLFSEKKLNKEFNFQLNSYYKKLIEHDFKIITSLKI